MANFAILEYMFMFDPGEVPFTSAGKFEDALNDFFNSKQIDAQMIDTKGNTGIRLIILSPKDKLDKLNNSNQPKPKGVANVPKRN